MATNVTATFNDEAFLQRTVTDMLYKIQERIVQELSHKVIAEKGKELIYDTLAKSREIQVGIDEKVRNEIKTVVDHMVTLRVAFEKKELCKCGETLSQHGKYNGVSLGTYRFGLDMDSHSFEAMDNLQFVEMYSDSINKWLDGFRAMVTACPEVKNVNIE